MVIEYALEFDRAAQKSWKKLDSEARKQFARKLSKRLLEPRVAGDKLHGLKDCYKIKLRSLGYRLVYQVIDDRLVVYVVSVGRRDAEDTYGCVHQRLTISGMD